jgi:hypothetical protein
MAGKMTRQHAIAAVVDGLAEAEERFGFPPA